MSLDLVQSNLLKELNSTQSHDCGDDPVREVYTGVSCIHTIDNGFEGNTVQCRCCRVHWLTHTVPLPQACTK